MASRSINPKLDRDSEFKTKKKKNTTDKYIWVTNKRGRKIRKPNPHYKPPTESNLPPKNGKKNGQKKDDDRFTRKPGDDTKFRTDAPGGLSKTNEGGKKNGNGKTNGQGGKTNGKGSKTNGNGKTNGKGGKTNGNGKPTKPTKEAVWDSEKFKWVIPQDKTETTEKPNKEKLKEKTTTGKGPVADPDEYGETLKEEKTKRDKAEADKKAAAEAVAKKERDNWLKKTRNSPAARAGFSDDERWAQQQKHRKWKADRKSGKLKEERKKKRKAYGAMGRGMRR